MLAMAHRGRASQLIAAAVMTAMAGAAGGCGGSAAAGGAPVSTSTVSTSTGSTGIGQATPGSGSSPAVSPTSSAWPVVVPVPAARPGLHQTGTRPSAHAALFRDEMTDLWAGVVSGRPALAMPAFFPLVAYEQVKAIANPAADWQNRLVAEYRADVMAAHGLLGGRARHATLVRVIVPAQQADWITPGVCDNAVGYWHVANARVVYRVGGQVRSFGIAALISWRGRWYVVHLGGELRTSAGGMIDQPASGPGTPGPPGGC
jgi:hypothetical protein